MLSQQILGYVAVLAGVVALVAFVRTPADQRWTKPQPEQETGVEYAEQYTKREQVKLSVTWLVIGLALLALLKFWAEPALKAFSKVAHCRELLDMNGAAFLIYAIFIGSGLLVTLFVGLPMAWYGLRVLREGQAPPRGKKVLKRIPIRRGRQARIIGYYNMLPLPLCIALTIYTAFASHAIVTQSHHAKHADSCTSSAVTLGAAQAHRHTHISGLSV